MWVQVSGMIGANSKSFSYMYSMAINISANYTVYQSEDSPRYFKANKGLLVICVWMCVSHKIRCPSAMYVKLMPLAGDTIPKYVLLL